MYSVTALIEKKRDGLQLAEDEIRWLIEGYVRGDVPDYQMSALAMAICLRGMASEETAALTDTMLKSGAVLRHPPDSTSRVVDKHSTGGIGDKTSLILAPLLASVGLRVPMISGRGLGITGGTLDKLESIPGFRTDLNFDEINRQLDSVGCVITGQTHDLCPADRKLYALRDVTGTVPSPPLIVSSIMSKKLAETLDSLVLDVKYGSGAFMKSLPEAQLLADEMKAVGRKMGVDVSALLTPMDEPLGTTVGNSLEIQESIGVLEGKTNSPDLRNLVLELAEMLVPSGRDELVASLESGAALAKWREMVAAQGGRPDFTAADLPSAPTAVALPAPESGCLRRLDAAVVGRVALELGAGRSKAGEAIDPAVGFSRIAKVGSPILIGEPVLVIHASGQGAANHAAKQLLKSAVHIGPPEN